MENIDRVIVEPQLVKVKFEDIKVSPECNKSGLYVKVRLRLSDFKKYFRNWALLENGRNTIVF